MSARPETPDVEPAKRAGRTWSVAAGVLGLIVLALGLVFNNQASFSKSYVHDQLAAHRIAFTPVAGLNDAQKNVPCLVENAGKQLTTGKQAECYANYQIGLDLPLVDNGKSYFEDHYAAYLLRLKAADAVRIKPNDPATVALVAQSSDLQRKADDLLAGEATKGLLLTAYGFSVLGARAGLAAVTCFVVGGVLLLGMAVSLAAGSRRRRPVGPVAAASPVTVPARRSDAVKVSSR